MDATKQQQKTNKRRKNWKALWIIKHYEALLWNIITSQLLYDKTYF